MMALCKKNPKEKEKKKVEEKGQGEKGVKTCGSLSTIKK